MPYTEICTDQITFKGEVKGQGRLMNLEQLARKGPLVA